MSSKFGTAKVFALLILFFVINYPLRAQAPAELKTRTDSIYRIPVGTRIRLRMEGAISSKFSTANDTFLARVAVPVVIRDVTVLPVGTLVEGRITEASPAGLGSRNGQMDFRMETLKFSDEVNRSIDGVPVQALKAKRHSGGWLPVIGGSILGAAVGFAVGTAPGAVIGAGIGFGIGAGARYSKKGGNVGLKDDDIFEIELKKEVVLPVLDY
jgi:hypothetical protein